MKDIPVPATKDDSSVFLIGEFFFLTLDDLSKAIGCGEFLLKKIRFDFNLLS